jgi:DNA polymerase, archaea type
LKGWILDLYPGDPGEMVIWIKGEDGTVRRFVDGWAPALFVASKSPSDLSSLAESSEIESYVAGSNMVSKYESIIDQQRSDVLELKVRDALKLPLLASIVERSKPFGHNRLYNVDVPPAQSYLYEKELFPLACCEVEQRGSSLSWTLDDDVWECDYAVPPLSSAELLVDVEKHGSLPSDKDPIRSLMVKRDGEKIVIDSGSEGDKVLSLAGVIRELDPDLVFTDGGDSFVLPYIVRRAQTCGVGDGFSLDREESPLQLPTRPGTSYFSYGKILYKPSTVRLRGRVHIDVANSFVCAEAGLDSFFELSRICRMPLHTSSRATIGRALSSLQFYNAYKQDLLVPWKPTLAESPKDRLELLIADRGGFTFEPRFGVYEDVAEYDFSSLYPNIMLKKNVSGETVRCSCCPDSKNRLPELGWNVCERRTGVVPESMEMIVGKRLQYKRLEKKAKIPEDKARYDARQVALKWIGVTSFGYLGHANAKFGRIDAHIAVCAWDREILLSSAKIAESHGFRVIHGIVDSLWLKKDGAEEEDYAALKEDVEKQTGFDLSFEGVYKWIAFLPSRMNRSLPVSNRYFGAYSDGRLKIRGVEARRHDTPALFTKCQMEILTLLAKADSVEEAKRFVPECERICRKYADAILKHEVSPFELVITRNISKIPSEYRSNTLEASAASQLVQAGRELHAGESIGYVITSHRSLARKFRTVPHELVTEDTRYDAGRYVELLEAACRTVLEPFA